MHDGQSKVACGQEVPFTNGGYEVSWQARRAALRRGAPATMGST